MSTDLLSTTTPTDPDTANVDDDIRKTKLAFAERLVQGGHRVANITPPVPITNEPADGLLAVGWETQVSQSDAGYLTLASDFAGATPYVRFFGSGHASALQFQLIGGAKYIGTNVTTGLDPGHLHTQGGVIGGKGGVLIAGYLKPSAFRWAKGTNEGTQTIKALYARVGVAPTGGSLVIEVRKSSGAPVDGADVYTNGVAITTIGTVTITVGNFGSSTTGLAVTIADGEVIVLNAITVSGVPSDLVMNAVVEG